MFGGWGGSSQQAPEAQAQTYQQPVDAYAQPGQAMDQGLYNSSATARNEAAGPCANDIKSFTECMNQNQGNMTICGYYLEQLKACQQAARQY
jgi:coiled-coil-helix-coiled-coil-helix domain-containing protein 2